MKRVQDFFWLFTAPTLIFLTNQDLYDATQELFQRDVSSMEALEGPIQFTHQFVDMPEYLVAIEDPESGPRLVMLFFDKAVIETIPDFYFLFSRLNSANQPWDIVLLLVRKNAFTKLT